MTGTTSIPRSEMPRFLIIDDHVAAADTLASLLQSSGHGEARIAHDSKHALALAEEFLPTVALIDLDLPDMNGYEVALQLSQRSRLRNLRLIALTDSDDRPGRERARTSGFERYLLKPVMSDALDELLAHPQ